MSDHQIAHVKIVNKSGVNFKSVFVLHKYSDLYKNSYSWNQVPNNSETNADMLVEYNTGWAIGSDWWYILAIGENGDTYLTDPSNGLAFFDFILKIGVDIASINPGSDAAGKLIGDLLASDESISGFKKFLLRKEDISSPISITLTSDEVVFEANSGTASTTFKCCALQKS